MFALWLYSQTVCSTLGGGSFLNLFQFEGQVLHSSSGYKRCEESIKAKYIFSLVFRLEFQKML